jgi:CDP-diacylglycerol--glycerol-3-phosphate 3-phosphatidyltransferase
MLTLYQIKPTFQNGLRPLMQRLAHWGITPNQITMAAIAVSVGTGLALATWPTAAWPLLSLPIVLLGRMALNALDGMLAREHGLATPLGCLLNELGDVIADIGLYLPFSLIPGVAAPLVVGVVILALLTELVGILGQAIAQHRPYDGPMGKSDRALVFAALGLLLGLGVTPGIWLSDLWIAIGLLELLTMVNRIRATLQEVSPCR